ncbi:MAG: hypothetical protein LBS59_03090 [Puniceicoccales bacterium]|jgi:hypothetical protein|nr:hypothetical protein [Puniceicoccales bacterium]
MPSFDTLQGAFSSNRLFADKTWHSTPDAFPLTRAQLDQIQKIGDACHSFYHAQELLYFRSANNKKILRNNGLLVPWVATYLDRGKPDGLVAHGRHRTIKGLSPLIIRPDLLLTENGFVLTEMDSVPGGIGLTAFLNELYAPDTPNLIGGTRQPDLFYRHLASLNPAKNTANPLIAIVISDEASTYRPEFEWLAASLRARHLNVHCVHPADLTPLSDQICAPVDGALVRVDILYRFFELFDLGNVKGADALFDAVEAGHVILTPPMKAYQEEKLNLALLHHPALGEYWRENLHPTHLETLLRVVPRTWIMEDVPLPPVAVLHAPTVAGNPVRAWTELANASQKERNLIIKASGFHETAWGSRSVTLGSDISRAEWLAAIEDATDPENETFYVMQDYHKPKRITHPIYQDNGSTAPFEGRARICPYYFAPSNPHAPVQLGAVLATLCPADKKIIHGMKDAILAPCTLTD